MQQAMVEATTASTAAVVRQNGVDESSSSSSTSSDEDEALDNTKGDEERDPDAQTEALLKVVFKIFFGLHCLMSFFKLGLAS